MPQQAAFAQLAPLSSSLTLSNQDAPHALLVKSSPLRLSVLPVMLAPAPLDPKLANPAVTDSTQAPQRVSSAPPAPLEPSPSIPTALAVPMAKHLHWALQTTRPLAFPASLVSSATPLLPAFASNVLPVRSPVALSLPARLAPPEHTNSARPFALCAVMVSLLLWAPPLLLVAPLALLVSTPTLRRTESALLVPLDLTALVANVSAAPAVTLLLPVVPVVPACVHLVQMINTRMLPPTVFAWIVQLVSCPTQISRVVILALLASTSPLALACAARMASPRLLLPMVLVSATLALLASSPAPQLRVFARHALSEPNRSAVFALLAPTVPSLRATPLSAETALLATTATHLTLSVSLVLLVLPVLLVKPASLNSARSAATVLTPTARLPSFASLAPMDLSPALIRIPACALPVLL
jgi:hypothetical protein